MRRLPIALSFVLFICGAASARNVEGVRFEGSESFSDAQLARALRRYDIVLTPPVDRPTADDAAYFLREFLNREGFPDANVEYAVGSGGDVDFTITEGPRFQLGRVTVEGAAQLGAERVSDIFIAGLRQATLTPFGRLRYVATAAEDAVTNITNAYVREGYLDAFVMWEPNINGRIADVTITVDEGGQYMIKDVVIDSGGIELPKAARDAALSFVGHAYRPGQELLCRTRVTDALRDSGYFKADVTEAVVDKTPDGAVLISFSVRQGDRFELGDIRVSGNRQTRLWAILRRLGLRPGAPYNAATVDAAIRRLWFSGAFSDVDTRQTPTPGEKVDVNIALSESVAKQVTGTVGYGEWEQFFGDATYTDRNFLGTLNRLSLHGFVSTKGFGGEGQLSTPWLFNRDLIGTFGAFAERRELPAFRSTQIGTGVGLERRLSDTNTSGWQFGYQWKSVLNSEIFAEDALDGAPINYTMGALVGRIIRDRRNDILSPMKGYLLRSDAALASKILGGDVSFARMSGQATWYQPLHRITPERPFIPFMIFNAKGGMILPYADMGDVPVQERYFLGGPDTVRSFQLDGMGPRDSQGEPKGGLAYFVTNTELQWPVWRGLYVASFADIGNLATTVEDFDWDDTRVGVGLGGRFYTPLGALRVDYGYNLIRGQGDPVGAWQFGFGFTF